MDQDIEQARAAHKALEALLRPHPGGWADTATLRKVQALCFSAHHSIEDHYCREKIGEVEEFAAILFSSRKHQRWGNHFQDGATVAKQRVLRALDSFERWLHTIENARRRRGQ